MKRDQMLRLSEIDHLLGVSVKQVRYAVRSGDLSLVTVKGARYVRASALQRSLDEVVVDDDTPLFPEA